MLSSESSDEGPRAWSLGVTATDTLEITGITTEGTTTEAHLRGSGFERTELIFGEGNEGAVSAVVLALSETGVSLPSIGETVVARVDVDGAFPIDGGCTEAQLSFVDGLAGSGLPMDTVVSVDGARVRPLLEPCTIELCGDGVLAPSFELGFAGACGETMRGAATSTFAAALDCTLGTSENPSDHGARGWSIGVAVGGGRINAITTAGTMADEVASPPGAA